MARFVKGEVVVVPFPFSSVPGAKRRPALVLASWAFGGSEDYLLALITSQAANDPFRVDLEPADIQGGTLARTSYVRPSYLFASDETLIVRSVGTLAADKLEAVIAKLVNLLRRT